MILRNPKICHTYLDRLLNVWQYVLSNSLGITERIEEDLKFDGSSFGPPL